MMTIEGAAQGKIFLFLGTKIAFWEQKSGVKYLA